MPGTEQRSCSLFGMDVHLFRKLEVEPAPMLLAFILGPVMQQFLRRTFFVSKSAPASFPPGR